MAKHSIIYRCGHTETAYLTGNRRTRDSYAEYASQNKDCSTCYQAALEAAREKENRESAEANAAAGLPALEGSEKQVAWAESIRRPAIERLRKVDTAELSPDLSPEAQAELRDALVLLVDEIVQQTSAKWWIDNREREPVRRVGSWIYDQIHDRGLAPTAIAEAKAIAERERAKYEAAEAAKQAEFDAREAKWQAEQKARQEEQMQATVKAQTFRFGDRPDRGIPWSDAPSSVHLTAAEQGGVLAVPDPHITLESRAVLEIVLVDAATGIIKALRDVSLSPEFTRALHQAIREQAEAPFDRRAYDRALQEAYRRWPTSEAMLRDAQARTRGGV
jgi:hypothetical protein